MDFRKVKNLVEMLESSKVVSEIEVRTGEDLVRVKRMVPTVQAQTTAAPDMPFVASAAPPAATTDDATTQDEGDETVKSPMVGTFYRAPNPTASPFVKIGDQVSKGQTLCIIEAMKTMNQIETPYTGTIKKIMVENGDPVEYGQDLFVIKPD